MFVGVVAPQNGVMPVSAKAKHAKTCAHILLETLKNYSETSMLLIGTQKFVGVIKLINFGYFNPVFFDVF